MPLVGIIVFECLNRESISRCSMTFHARSALRLPISYRNPIKESHTRRPDAACESRLISQCLRASIGHRRPAARRRAPLLFARVSAVHGPLLFVLVRLKPRHCKCDWLFERPTVCPSFGIFSISRPQAVSGPPAAIIQWAAAGDANSRDGTDMAEWK